jgi:hypothetical protein
MSDATADEILHLEQLALTLRRRQRMLETQNISYGTLAVPALLVLELEDVRRELARALADLRRLHPGRSGDQAPYVGLLTFQEADMLLERVSGQRLVLVVDQFEEIWTLAPAEPDAREVWLTQQHCPFVDLLLTAAAVPDTPLLIVIAMRADFLHRAAEHNELARLIAEHLIIVSPMTTAELREAIGRPADQAGGGFEPGLVGGADRPDRRAAWGAAAAGVHPAGAVETADT